LTEIEQFAAKLLMFYQIFGGVTSRCDLDLWSHDLELFTHSTQLPALQ